MLLLAAPVLHAPDDPGQRGLWGIVAFVLLVALVAAHVRVLRAVAREIGAGRFESARTEEPSASPQPGAARPAE